MSEVESGRFTYLMFDGIDRTCVIIIIIIIMIIYNVTPPGFPGRLPYFRNLRKPL